MPLRVLDGNQTATTLSSVITGGEHIVAHTVVSLGPTAISNIASAVSGSVVSISNFPSTQTIAGTVTANLTFENLHALGVIDDSDKLNCNVNAIQGIDPAGWLKSNGGNVPIAGTVTANLPALNWNTVKITYGEKTVFNGIYKKGSSGYVDQTGGGTPEYLPVDGFFHGGTIVKLTRGTYLGGSLIFTGTRWYFEADGEVQFYSTTTASDLRVIADWTDSGGPEADVQIAPYSVEPVAIPNGVGIAYSGSTEPPSLVTNSNPFPVKVQNSVTIGSLPAISGTVTANSIFPRVTLIDGSGTVTTANTAITVFASSSTRSYLLVQVTTGSAFVNVGATATTVNGLSLTAGQGYSWETTIPQGVVSLISTTTSSRWVAKEA